MQHFFEINQNKFITEFAHSALIHKYHHFKNSNTIFINNTHTQTIPIIWRLSENQFRTTIKKLYAIYFLY